MNNFKKLKVWQKSVEFAVFVYSCTKKFPTEEKYGLSSQINRCAVSIASNIAEGCGRNSEKEFSHFLAISKGSSYELETQLIIANKIGILPNEDFAKSTLEINEIQKMIFALNKSVVSKFKNLLFSWLL